MRLEFTTLASRCRSLPYTEVPHANRLCNWSTNQLCRSLHLSCTLLSVTLENEEVAKTHKSRTETLIASIKILNIEVVIQKLLQMAVKADVCKKKVPSKFLDESKV